MGPKTDTRQRLLAAAIKILEAGGEQAIRVQEVADAAGVTKPSVYHFFGSREGLIECAQGERYQRGFTTIIDSLDQALQRSTTRDEFFSVINEHIELAHSDARKAVRRRRVAVLGSAMSRPALAESLANAQDAADLALANALRLGQTKGWIPPDLDLVVFSDWFLNQTTGRILVDITSKESEAEQWNQISKMATLALLGCPPYLIETFEVGT